MSRDPGRRDILGGVGLCLAGLLSATITGRRALAHRLNAALTVVEVNLVRGTLDVTHRMYAHDLEHAFSVGRVDLDWFEGREGRAILGRYCADRFTVEWGDSGVVPLAFLGTEVIGDLVYVYLDSPLSGLSPADGPVDVTVWSGLLQDVSRDQRNLVNLRRSGITTTLGFAAGDGPRSVRID
jgi:hypothetical protein